MTMGQLAAARCLICGQGFAVPAWICERCQTPHHEECVTYFGGCAIFGCRDGNLPDRIEVASWPRALRWVNAYIRLRRAKLTMTLFTVGSAPLFVAGLGLGLLDLFLYLGGSLVGIAGQLWILSAMLFLGAGGAVALCEVASWFVALVLRGLFALDAERSFEIPASRMRHAMNPVEDASPLQRRLRTASILCWMLGFLGFVLMFLLTWFRLWALGTPAMVLSAGLAILFVPGVIFHVCAGQLREDDRTLQAWVRRFEATYAPRLEKGGAGRSDDSQAAGPRPALPALDKGGRLQ